MSEGIETALILCAGESTRMGEKHRPKCLLNMGPETLLGRIVRQCQKRAIYPVVVTHLRAVAEVAQKQGARVCVPEARRWTPETLLSTRAWWQRRTIVLLGDVLYSKRLFDTIAGLDRLAVVGHEYEILGLVLTREQEPLIVAALRRAIDHAEQGGPGKLRTFYQALAGLPMGTDASEDKLLIYWNYATDYSQDVDTWHAWQDVLMKQQKHLLRDER